MIVSIQAIQAAITKYYKMGGLQTPESYFSQLWRLGSIRSRHWQIWGLIRAHFLFQRWPSHYNLTWHKGWGTILRFLHELPSWPNHLPKALPLNSITLEIRFQQINLEHTNSQSMKDNVGVLELQLPFSLSLSLSLFTWTAHFGAN
jgi:hypothetical protein